MGRIKKAKRRRLRVRQIPYDKTRAEMAQRVTEENTQQMNPVSELSNIMSKMKMKDEGECEIPGLDLVKDQKEEPIPEVRG